MEFFRKDSRLLYGRLDNGLTYYIRQNDTPRGMACFYLVKRIGSVMEEDGEQGYAHFLEHMSFEGMEGFPASEVIHALESIGVRFGDELNAYTNAEETVYTLKNVPVSGSNVDLCLSAIRGWLCGLELNSDAVESERGIVLDEFRVTANPMQRMFDKMQSGIYPNCRYGERPVLGTEKSISSLTSEKLREFYRKWSRFDLSAIIAVGDFNTEDILKKIKSMDFPISSKIPERPIFNIPDNIEPIILSEHDPEQEFPRAAIWIKRDVQAVDYIDSHDALLEDYVMELVVRILNSRFQYIANSNQPPFLESYVSLSDFLLASTKRMMEIIVDTENGKFKEGLLSCLIELKRAFVFGFTQTELEKAKRGWMNSMETNYNERGKRANDSFCNEYMRNFTRHEPIPSIEDEHDFAIAVLPKIILEDVNEAAKRILDGTNMVVAGFLPNDCHPDFAGIINSVKIASVEPYEDTKLTSGIIDTLPPTAEIESEKVTLYDYQCFTLSNGANVYLKTTDFTNDEILLKCIRSKGRKNYPSAVDGFALEYIIECAGLGKYSRQDLCAMIEERQIEIRHQSGALMFSMECSSNCRDFEILLQMIYLYFTARRKDKDAFAMCKERLRNMLKTNQSNPVEDVYRLSDSALFDDSGKYTKILPEQIDDIDYDQAFAIADDLFSDASSFDFVITGNITAETLRPLIRQYIATLPSLHLCRKQELSHILKPTKETSIVRKKLETPAAYSLITMANYVDCGIRSEILIDLAAQLLDMELMENIREKDGEVYSIYCYGYLSSFLPSVAFLYIFFQSECGREKQILEKIDKVLSSIPSEDKLSRCIEYMIKQYKNDLRTNKFFQKKLISYLISGNDTVTDYEKVLNSIKIEDVLQMLSSLGIRKNILLLPSN